jgi:hypothetical protein
MNESLNQGIKDLDKKNGKDYFFQKEFDSFVEVQLYFWKKEKKLV